jgi:SAM-dependent methyltransferase
MPTAAIESMKLLLDEEPVGIIEDIAPDDGMYAYAPELYPVAGREGLRSVRLAMLAAGLDRAERILDFACGAGRVLRYLRAAFPDASITACDVLEGQVEFCSRTFGVTGVVSDPRPEEIELDGPFDVIWCGSLLTHVDHDLWVKFVQVMESVLAPGGVMVFTVLGRFRADQFRTGENRAGFTDEQAERMVRDYDADGFGFQAADGRPEDGFGDCLVSPAWVCARLNNVAADLDLLLYLEHGWMAQDVVAARKRA